MMTIRKDKVSKFAYKWIIPCRYAHKGTHANDTLELFSIE